MANEITLTGSLAVYKSTIMSSAIGRSFSGMLATMSASNFIQGTVSVGTSAEAIPLGDVSAPHWSFWYNLDSTNYIKIRNGSGGADVVRLKATMKCFFPFETTGAPYAIAVGGACILEYLILGE